MAAGCLLRDRLEELWLHIDQLHLTYLEADESPRKLDEKKRLEAYIREYLCIAPHDRKFCLDATREILHRSVESKEDFSAYRATQAWSAIAGYAHNLLAQPWRKEFHEIKTYCGYYKHHVQSGLVGAELILEAMGYKRTSQSSLVLDGPVDPDRVSIVSQDSLIALVECQIMRTIYAEVLKLIPTCSWSDVLRFREQHAGSPEQAITCLNYRLRQEQYQPPLTHMDSCGAMARYAYPHPYATNRYYNFGYNQPRYAHTVISPMQQYPLHPPPATHPHYYDQYYGYYPIKNGCMPTPPLVTCSVPTAQLIELDPPSDPIINTHRRSSSDHRIEADYRKNCSADRYQMDVYNNRHPTISDEVSSVRKDKNKDWDNWDFVYKTLEGKRGGIPEDNQPVNSSNERWERQETKTNNITSPVELEEALKAFSLNDQHQITVPDPRTKKLNEPTSKLSNSTIDDAQLSTRNSSSSSNRISTGIYTSSDVSPHVQTNDNAVIIPTSPKHHAQTTVRPQKKNELKDDSSKFLSVDTRRLRVKLTDEKWECVTCTYHNSVDRDVCEMCGKSKKVGSETRPLASGGRQCPQCTLVNEKGVTTCEACGCCLKDSPTYI